MKKLILLYLFLFYQIVSIYPDECVTGDCKNGNGTMVYEKRKKPIGDRKSVV